MPNQQPYTHIYTNYVNHILNHSPSKTTYTFPKAQRFSSPILNNSSSPLDQILQKMDDKHTKNFPLSTCYNNNNYISQSYQKQNKIKKQNNWMDTQIRQIKHKLNKTYAINQNTIEQQLNDMRLARPKDKSLSKSKSNINVNVNMKKNKSYKNINNTANNVIIYDNLQALSPKNKQKTARSPTNNTNHHPPMYNLNNKFQPSLHTRSKSHSKFSQLSLNQLPQKSLADKSMEVSSLYNHNKGNNHNNKTKSKSKSNNKTKSPNKKKKQSPIKYLKISYNNNIDTKNSIHKSDSKYLKYSPYYNSNNTKLSHNNPNTQYLHPPHLIDEFTFSHQIKRPCKQKQRDLNYYEISPAKKAIYTTTQILQQINHPSKKITPHGYYPIGVQISQRGKFPVSTYKNVITHSFGPPPVQKQAHGYNSPEKKHPLINYQNHPNNVFIQSDKKNNKKFCYSDMIKELNGISINPYNMNFNEDKYYGQRVYTENYTPFSEFGSYKNK